MFRADSQKLNWEKTPGGLLKAFITLGSANKPLDYFSFNGKQLTKRTESITMDELKADASLASAYGSPITLNHPKNRKFNGNKEGLMIGSLMQEIVVDGDSVLIAGTISDQRGDRLIKEVQERNDGLLPEISPGYFLGGLREDSGTFWQQNRQYDHHALLYPKTGRGGQNVTLRLDAKDAISTAFEASEPKKLWTFNTDQKTEEHPPKDKKAMPTILLGQRVFNTDSATDLEALPGAVAQLSADKEKAETEASKIAAKVTALEAEKAELSTQVDTEKGRADAADIKLKELETKLKELEGQRLDAAQLAADRKSVIEAWDLVLPTLRADNKDFEPNYALGVEDIQKLYLLSKKPDINLDEASPDYIKAMWDLLAPTGEEIKTDSVDPVDALKGLITKQKREPRNDGKSYQTRGQKRAERIKAAGMKSTQGAA